MIWLIWLWYLKKRNKHIIKYEPTLRSSLTHWHLMSHVSSHLGKAPMVVVATTTASTQRVELRCTGNINMCDYFCSQLFSHPGNWEGKQMVEVLIRFHSLAGWHLFWRHITSNKQQDSAERICSLKDLDSFRDSESEPMSSSSLANLVDVVAGCCGCRY